MPDPKIAEAKKWCEEARKLLNMVSYPGSDRWVMGNRVIGVDTSFKDLETLAKSPLAKGKYQGLATEYENLGKRAKEAAKNKDNEEIKKISDELDAFSTKIDKASQEITAAKAGFANAKKAARAEFKAIKKRVGGDEIPAQIAGLKGIIDGAQADFDNEHYLEAMVKLETTFKVDALEAKRLATKWIVDLAETNVTNLKATAAFTSDVNKNLIKTELQGLMNPLDATVTRAKDALAAMRLNAAEKVALNAYHEERRIGKIAPNHAAFVKERVKVEGLVAALPTDNAAINAAVGSKVIGDYKVDLAAGAKKGVKYLYEAAAELIAKAETACVAAKKIKEDAEKCATKLTDAQKLIEGLPKENPLIKTDVEALVERMRVAQEKATVLDFAGAEAIAAEITTTHGILAGLVKNDKEQGDKAKEAAGKDDPKEAIKALREIWTALGKRTPEAVPKAIEEELKQIDLKLKAAEAAFAKQPETVNS